MMPEEIVFAHWENFKENISHSCEKSRSFLTGTVIMFIIANNKLHFISFSTSKEYFCAAWEKYLACDML
jgi:hypothetical protein